MIKPTLIHTAVQTIQEKIKLRMLTAIPRQFDLLKSRATSILVALERGVLPSPAATPDVICNGVGNELPAEPRLAPSTSDSRIFNSTFAERVPIDHYVLQTLHRNVADMEENIEQLAGETIPVHLKTLDDLLVNIHALARRPLGLDVPPTNSQPLASNSAQPQDSTRVTVPTSDSTETHSIPRARSLMIFSQELQSAMFKAATGTIFQFSDIFGGLNPYEREVMLSATEIGPGTYEDIQSKLETLEHQLIQNVITSMDPEHLLSDRDGLHRQVERVLQSNGQYRDLHIALWKLRASRLRSHAILEKALTPFGESDPATRAAPREAEQHAADLSSSPPVPSQPNVPERNLPHREPTSRVPSQPHVPESNVSPTEPEPHAPGVNPIQMTGDLSLPSSSSTSMVTIKRSASTEMMLQSKRAKF
ncbi:hypothetical protein VP01_1204g2 [Puccinia sorghi]|uniref:Uncharacterized protein n=1 Tax=Puccinia sorghi TaxID=27349 RepID=A0A0L6VRX0_9BASI|nr:hypothetical protein VP01_1204g2 [Puccinia sorghi]